VHIFCSNKEFGIKLMLASLGFSKLVVASLQGVEGEPGA